MEAVGLTFERVFTMLFAEYSCVLNFVVNSTGLKL